MWSRAWLLGLVGACYAPTLTTGAPCDPTIDNCPAGQVCGLRAGEYRCGGPGESERDAAIEIDASIIDALDAAFDGPMIDGPMIDAPMIDAPMIDAPMIDAPIDAPPPPVNHVEYVAVVADCVNPANPNPDTCKSVNGSAQITIDADDSMTGNPWVGYIRFDVDNVLAGRTVTSLKLRLVASSDPKADAPNTGQIWRVNPFTRTSLFSAPVPARIGSTPLAPSQGSVNQLQVIQWTLPVTLATANGSVYLEIQTTSADGTNYWNLTGANPPRLVVDLL